MLTLKMVVFNVTEH